VPLKVSDSDYAMQPYRSAWSKLYKYTQGLGLTDRGKCLAARPGTGRLRLMLKG